MQAVDSENSVQRHPVSVFLDDFSIEITAKHLEKISQIAERVKPGTHTYVAMIDPGDFPDMLKATKALRESGLEPVPHIPARFTANAAQLEEWLNAYAGEAGVDHTLVLGGGAPEPVGDFDAAIQLLRTGAFEKHDIKLLGFAGHPEGNADIEKVVGKTGLIDALREKQAFADETGAQSYIATQFLFEAAPVAIWAETLRAEGIDMAINVGVPGPATLKTLVRYAAVCGVGASARLIRKQALNVTKLMSVNAPDGFVAGLADLHFNRPELGIQKAHMYPFGGFDRLFDWIDDIRKD
ncbi:MAG: methylenetetrahydrofolate reductase [Hyphomicrobiales bacterium]